MNGSERMQGRIAFIGAGNMAEALIRGVTVSGVFSPSDITASDVSQDRLSYIRSKYDIGTETDNRKALADSGIIILCVKPQHIQEVAEEISADLREDKLVISIAAGVSLARIKAVLNFRRIIRVMPNTPALVLQGMTCICKDDVLPEDLLTARRIFESVGRVVTMEERHMDAVTGLSGSGPAYCFLIIEALADGGVKMGLPRSQALELAIQTMKGSASLISELGLHPGALKDMVASPGGTTIMGLHALEKRGVRGAIMDAVENATLRSRELGKL